MNVKLNNVETNVVELEIKIDKEVFQESMEKSYMKNKNRFNIPGFRKGKAPRKIIERHYGEQILYDDAINFACPEAYEEALKEKDINPVTRPEIDIKQIGNGQDFIFTVKVTVKPEVKLGEYKGLKVEKAKVNITEEDVEKELKSVAEKNARLISVEDRDIQDGDTLNIDFEGFKDGEPFEGGKAEGHTLVIGSGSFIPGFEEQLIGAKLGQETEIKVKFPDEYQSKDLAGQDVVFKVKINEIKCKELPELDDEFAKDVSELDTLEEYKADIAKKLEETKENEAKHEMEENLISQAVENATIELPQVMVDNQVDLMLREIDTRLRYQGMDLQKYMQMMGIEESVLKEERKEDAEKEVRTQLVLEKIAVVEEIKSSDEELEEELNQMAERYKQKVEDFKKHLREDDIEYIKGTIITNKTVKFLVDNANVK